MLAQSKGKAMESAVSEQPVSMNVGVAHARSATAGGRMIGGGLRMRSPYYAEGRTKGVFWCER